jgi:hypothetical protein
LEKIPGEALQPVMDQPPVEAIPPQIEVTRSPLATPTAASPQLETAPLLVAPRGQKEGGEGTAAGNITEDGEAPEFAELEEED